MQHTVTEVLCTYPESGESEISISVSYELSPARQPSYRAATERPRDRAATAWGLAGPGRRALRAEVRGGPTAHVDHAGAAGCSVEAHTPQMQKPNRIRNRPLTDFSWMRRSSPLTSGYGSWPPWREKRPPGGGDAGRGYGRSRLVRSSSLHPPRGGDAGRGLWSEPSGLVVVSSPMDVERWVHLASALILGHVLPRRGRKEHLAPYEQLGRRDHRCGAVRARMWHDHELAAPRCRARKHVAFPGGYAT